MEAADALKVPLHVCDSRTAYYGHPWKRRVLWRLAGRRPARLAAFSADVLATARRERPDVLLATGIAPIDEQTLKAVGQLGIRRVNFLTDDPWNPVHRAPWFLSALPHYDHVWSPRHANLHDLRCVGVKGVAYLPFGYNPAVHWPQSPDTDSERREFDVEVLVAGGADAERVALLAPIVRSGVRVALYGGYWDRYSRTRRCARGFLDAERLRKATSTARVCLGLVRRANRDGHSMRTYEIPAMHGCLLAERTSDHERLFGREGESVLYFGTAEEAVRKVAWLLEHPSEREALARGGYALITSGGHTYRDRLAVMLGLAGT
jgi:spore maturation protein CgeB